MKTQQIIYKIHHLGFLKRCQFGYSKASPNITNSFGNHSFNISRHFSLNKRTGFMTNNCICYPHLNKRESNTFSGSSNNNVILNKNLLDSDIRKSQLPLVSCDLHKHTLSKCEKSCESPKHLNTRNISITPQAILEASPMSWQPYMRLARFDKPIGKLLKK